MLKCNGPHAASRGGSPVPGCSDRGHHHLQGVCARHLIDIWTSSAVAAKQRLVRRCLQNLRPRRGAFQPVHRSAVATPPWRRIGWVGAKSSAAHCTPAERRLAPCARAAPVASSYGWAHVPSLLPALPSECGRSPCRLQGVDSERRSPTWEVPLQTGDYQYNQLADMPADFGPPLKAKGVSGLLVVGSTLPRLRAGTPLCCCSCA